MTELERDKSQISVQLQQLSSRADTEALSRRVAEEDIAELEKEKMMVELELKEMDIKHKADVRNLELQLASLKDTESDLLQKIDQLNKDSADFQMKIGLLQEKEDLTDSSSEVRKRCS